MTTKTEFRLNFTFLLGRVTYRPVILSLSSDWKRALAEVLFEPCRMRLPDIFSARPDELCPDVTKTFVPAVDDFAWVDGRPANK